MAQVETVRGPVDTAALGRTLMHEHVFVLSTEILQNYGGDWWDEEERVTDAVTKLQELVSRGFSTVVDPTVIPRLAKHRETAPLLPDMTVRYGADKVALARIGQTGELTRHL